ncbi:hypothetical protein [Flavobacterium sp. CS20]|uniref:hypothetical protein n=1 Tax=Flavobacterium sp. CS20 TaxID=2775246 RepID=UPI001B3A518E|nr:hypothetical protein [Flavobacterium sp. CS20]QTY27451.1 hypothetical protein IGB25_02485 [Flavobacterium sp. CS20]
MRFLKIGFLLIFTIQLSSCKSVSKAIGNPDVYLYKDQAQLMNGTYFIDPYKTNGKSKLLTEIFDLKEAENVEKVDFNFIDNKHLQISYTDGLRKFSKVIEGKMKNGAFRYEYKNFPIGIPFFLFAYNFKVHHIALGNDDNIIITEYDYVHTQNFINGFNEKTVENRYYFDRQLK